MKKVIIPTDFSIKSLQLIAHVAQFYPDELTDVLLVYGYRISDIDDKLSHSSSSQIIRKLADGDFLEAKADMQKKFCLNINSIHLDVFTGTNSFAFQNYRDSHQIHDAIIPNKGFLKFSGSSCFDPSKYISKNIATVCNVNLANDFEPKKKQRSKSFIKNLLKR
ncbi:hypothetical protein H0I23_09030 [Cellulophaga sp. HaHaR_3_176]|uniref:hypothetical protein n=1 Tax=Cellulophaga sp. HaHaR_3_176 TaxID=1942464 RepID=UPI001C1FCCBD|nr:hypothetical protein [Cellulophaga sp. HaHaR_3_176]QWX82613.1 hypothetical protein H0I23_09030 [Cellulophaga sp. HaHaR_3_176]